MPREVVRRDRKGAVLGAAIWIVGSLKVAPQMPRMSHVESATGALAMVGAGIVWPTLHERSYLRWRTAAVGIVRLLIMSMPTNYNTALFDAMTPALATGRFAGLINLSTILLGTHACLLLFLALLMPLPLRAHMRVQTASVAMLLAFGVHTHCRSHLFNTPEFASVVAVLHDLMSLVSGTLTPLAVAAPPGSYAQSVSALLMTWALVGWLLPTLMLLPFEGARPPAHSAAGGLEGLWRLPLVICDRLDAAVEAWLRRLLPLPAPRRRPAGEQAARGGNCVLCWLVTLCALWVVCCTVAPLYGGSDAPRVDGA